MKAALALVAGMAVAGAVVHELDHRAAMAVGGEAEAVAAQSAVADALTTTRDGGATVIHFERGVAPNSLGPGWSEPEKGLGVWSSGRVSVLRLVGLPRHARVALTLEPFLAPGLASQRVRIRDGERVLSETTLSKPGWRTVQVEPPETGGAAELSLDLPDADQPKRRLPGSTDSRTLAVMLRTVEISPSTSAP